MGVEGVDLCVESVEARVEKGLHTVETGVETSQQGVNRRGPGAVGRIMEANRPIFGGCAPCGCAR